MNRQLRSLVNIRSLLREPGRKKKLYIFLVCLFCSASFWLFIKLSRNTQASFEIPIGFSNVASDVVIARQSSSSLGYTLQTTGLKVLGSRFRASGDTLKLDAASLGRINRGGELWHFVAANQLSMVLANYLEGGRDLLNVFPDTVFVKLEFASEKKVPVLLNGSFSFEKRFGQYGDIVLTPDSTVVRGPKNMVDTLQALYTEAFVFENLTVSINERMKIINPGFNSGLQIQDTHVDFFIPVEEFTEATLELGLQVICADKNNAAATRLRLFPNRVEVICLVALKDYSLLDPALFFAHVNCPDHNQKDLKTLEVFIDTYPGFVSIQNIRPANVEFLILE